MTLTSKERKLVYDFLYATFQFYLLHGYTYPQQLREIGKTCSREGEGDDEYWPIYIKLKRKPSQP